MENESGMRSRAELHTPFVTAFSQEVQQAPQLKNKDGIRTVLEEIDTQSINNFTVFNSEKFPGTQISYTKLSITPELITKLQKQNRRAESYFQPDQSEIESHNEQFFLLNAFGQAPHGNAFFSMDQGIDRFFREIPRVAKAVREGKEPPKVDIYMIGSGTGAGEKVSSDFVQQFKEKGFDARGKLSSEIISSLASTEEEMKNTRVVLQGVSMGGVTINHTMPYMPKYLQDNTQILLDHPTGTHKPYNIFKSIQVATVLAELKLRKSFDKTVDVIDRQDPVFTNYLKRQKNLTEDTPEELSLKNDLVRAAALKLTKGQPIDESRRMFVRDAVLDVTNTNLKRMGRVLLAKNKPLVAHTSNKAFHAITGGTHFFPYENYERWDKNVGYAQKISVSSQPEASAESVG